MWHLQILFSDRGSLKSRGSLGMAAVSGTLITPQPPFFFLILVFFCVVALYLVGIAQTLADVSFPGGPLFFFFVLSLTNLV